MQDAYIPLGVFIADEITVPAGFGPAASRLLHVINKGALHHASTAAYEEGLTAILRVGPFGEVPGASKLVRVQFLAPARRGATMTVPLRWEAAGPAGDLFPVLDADLILARDGDDQVQLGLSGSYRPPFGRAGAVLDRALMRRVAVATFRSLLENMSQAIADPAPEPRPEPGPAATWPLVRPEEALPNDYGQVREAEPGSGRSPPVHRGAQADWDGIQLTLHSEHRPIEASVALKPRAC